MIRPLIVFYRTKHEEAMQEPERTPLSTQQATEQPVEKPIGSTGQRKSHIEPSQLETAKQIARQLDEREPHVLWKIVKIVKALGETQTRALLTKTLEIEANGGMMVPDHSRRRTAGGVFFHLVSTTGQPMEGQTLKRAASQKSTPDQKPQQKAPSPSLPLHWQDRGAVLDELQAATALATAKITLRGKVSTYANKGTYTTAVLQSEKSPSLPRGLPERPESQTSYVVFIGSKQWKAIATTLTDPQDLLTLEGYPQMNLQTRAVNVFVTSVTSNKQQEAKRQAKKKEGQAP